MRGAPKTKLAQTFTSFGSLNFRGFGEGTQELSHHEEIYNIMHYFTWRNHRLPSPPPINSSVRLSVRPSVHACRLGIQRKIAQAQQIRSNFLENHESTSIVNLKFFEIKYINERKHSK